MGKNDDLDILVKNQFQELYSELDIEKRKFINPKSLQNILFHLVENPRLNPRKNQKLQELGEIRMKNKLLEFFELARSTDLDVNSASNLYIQNFMKIGKFMTEYYGFSSNAGKNIVISILIVLAIGGLIDLILFVLNWTEIPIFSLLFVIIYLVRRVIKYQSKRQYGLFY